MRSRGKAFRHIEIEIAEPFLRLRELRCAGVGEMALIEE